jgi:hypothetical protein
MNRGVWHQLGDRSQRMVIEQLKQSIGSGVIISPRDLTRQNAVNYAKDYHNLGASVIIDQQFHVPGFTNDNLQSYETEKYRQTISTLNKITDSELDKLSSELRIQHYDLSADAIIAPAVVYEAARDDIIELNARLFSASKQVGDDLGIPTYATVILGRSANSSQQVIQSILSCATSLNSDGWYFGFEFSGQRIPSEQQQVYQCLVAGLTLACTGRPVLHSYSGPMALLSMGFGATGTAIGHSQNLWQFTRARWQEPTSGRGGAGDAPPRFFSTSLWGTVIYPDELIQIPQNLRTQIYTPSQFSPQDIVSTPLRWDRWSANKHLLNQIGTKVTQIAANTDAKPCANIAISHLNNAVLLHEQLERAGIKLRDQTNTYQANWSCAVSRLITEHAVDFDYLELLR